MINITIAWLALPFFIGFVIYLLPKLDRILAIGIAMVSARSVESRDKTLHFKT